MNEWSSWPRLPILSNCRATGGVSLNRGEYIVPVRAVVIPLERVLANKGLRWPYVEPAAKRLYLDGVLPGKGFSLLALAPKWIGLTLRLRGEKPAQRFFKLLECHGLPPWSGRGRTPPEWIGLNGPRYGYRAGMVNRVGA